MTSFRATKDAVRAHGYESLQVCLFGLLELVLVDFGKNRYGYQTSWRRSGGGSNSAPGALP